MLHKFIIIHFFVRFKLDIKHKVKSFQRNLIRNESKEKQCELHLLMHFGMHKESSIHIK